MNRNWGLRIIGIVAAILILGCIWQTWNGRMQMDGQRDEKASSNLSRQEMHCEKNIFAMDTIMTFTAYGEHAEKAVDAAIAEVQYLDAMLSTGKEDSEISILNRDGVAEVSGEVIALLNRSMEIYEKTDGMFDPTIYPLMELWGFPTGEYHVAEGEELNLLLPYVNASLIETEEKKIVLGDGQKIDFGAIAKGYTSARLMDIYRMNGIISGMVYLGGNVQTLGTRPDGKKWVIGLQDPEGEQGSVLMALSVQDQAVITSGGYERYFEEDGKRYIHILDPRTGKPVENDLVSVTIVSRDGTLADALSTSLFIMGKDDAIEFWRKNAEDFQMILLTEDGMLHITEALIPDVQCNRKYEVINKNVN